MPSAAAVLVPREEWSRSAKPVPNFQGRPQSAPGLGGTFPVSTRPGPYFVSSPNGPAGGGKALGVLRKGRVPTHGPWLTPATKERFCQEAGQAFAGVGGATVIEPENRLHGSGFLHGVRAAFTDRPPDESQAEFR